MSVWCTGATLWHSLNRSPCHASPDHLIGRPDTPGTDGSRGPAESFHEFDTDLVANAIWREPVASGDAPSAGDAHLWALLAAHPQAQLVTGDRLLIENPPSGASVTSPRCFLDTFLSPKATWMDRDRRLPR